MRRARAALAACGVALLAACIPHAGRGSRAPLPALTPWGLPRAEQALRDALAAGAWDDAVARAADPARGAPADALLRALYEGSAAYEAGRLAESAAAFERAAALAEERETWRLSRGAAALATSDRALPYVPGEHERLLAHQYAMLARLRAGDAEGAAVEARRLDALLARLGPARGRGERDLRAMTRYLSGVAFERAGQRTDAEVAYRNARELGVVDSASVDSRPRPRRGRRAPPEGEVVVLIERGFAAHRVDTRLRVRAARAPSDGGSDVGALAEGLGALLASHLGDDQGVWSDAAPDVLRPDGRTRGRRGELLTLAWPAYRRPAPLAAALGVALSALPLPVGPASHPADRPMADPERTPHLAPVLLAADVSEALAADLRRDRAGMLARLVARAAVRQAVVGEARRRAPPLGDLLSSLGRSVERADTRSWHLLPGRIEVVRMRLPAGRRELALDLGGASVPLGAVEVPAGGLALHTVRLWGRETPPARTASF